MDAAGFAAAPTAEQEGTYTINQTITCHYHVYAPTTVHASAGRPRCVTESSSEAPSRSSALTSISQASLKIDLTCLRDLGPETATKSKPEGKRQAILEWLIAKLAALLRKVSHK